MPLTETEARYLAGWNSDFVPWPDEILTDDKHALMTQRAFDKLPDYSMSSPTGTYPGKRWKAKRAMGVKWWLQTCGEVVGDQIVIRNREIIIVDAKEP